MHDRPCIMGQTFLFVSTAQFSHAVILMSHLGKRQNGQCRLIVGPAPLSHGKIILDFLS